MGAVSNIGPQIDLTLRQGADFGPMTLTFTAGGAPVDLTGCTLAAQLRKTALGAAHASFEVDVTDPTNGVATLSMESGLTRGLSAGETMDDPKSQYVWDLKLLDSLGRVSTPLWGNVTVFRLVTR